MKCLICMVRRVPKSFDHLFITTIETNSAFFSRRRVFIAERSFYDITRIHFWFPKFFDWLTIRVDRQINQSNPSVETPTSLARFGFFLNYDWLRKWRNIGHPITMRYGHKSQSNDAITFDSLLKGLILFLHYRNHTQIPWLQFLVGTFIVRNAGLEHWYELLFLVTIMVFYMYLLKSFQVFVVKPPYCNKSFLNSPRTTIVVEEHGLLLPSAHPNQDKVESFAEPRQYLSPC